MRILTIGGDFFIAAFRRLGHEVLALGNQARCDVRLAAPLSLKQLLELLHRRAFTPDIVLWCDTCTVPMVMGLETLPAVTIGLSIDQYANPWHAPYATAFDGLLIAQKDYLGLFPPARASQRVEWFPLFFDPDFDRDLGLTREVPVSFVGTLKGSINVDRWPFLQAFRSRCPMVLHQGAYVELFNRSRIVVNQSAVGELNFRLFQAAACGAAVLTEATQNGLTDLFTPGENVLVYPRGDAGAAAAVALAALKDQQPDGSPLPAGSLARLAKNGQRSVRAAHSATLRAKRILALATELAAAAAPKDRLARLDQVQAEQRKAWTILATDEQLPLSPEERRFFLSLAGYGS